MHGQVPASRKGSVQRFIVGTFFLLLVLAVCGGLIWFNFFRDKMIAQFFAHFPVPTITVSTVEVTPQKWTPGIDAVGTVSAAQGVEVAGQVGGVVKAVNFKGNDKVAAGAVLVQIDDSLELRRPHRGGVDGGRQPGRPRPYPDALHAQSRDLGRPADRAEQARPGPGRDRADPRARGAKGNRGAVRRRHRHPEGRRRPVHRGRESRSRRSRT